MDSEKQSLDEEQFSQAIALINLNAAEENFMFLSHLIAEASDRYPQLSQLQCERISLPISKLEGWSYWLAAQIVEQWRNLPVAAESSVAKAIAALGLSSTGSKFPLVATLDQTTTDTSLTQQLAVRVKALDKQQRQKRSFSSQQQWLDQEIAKLAKWFNQPLAAIATTPLSSVAESGGMAQLQFNVLTLRSRLQQQLPTSLPQLPHAGSQAILSWLSAFGKALAEIQAVDEVQRQDNLQRESSAWRAYYKLRTLLPRHRQWSNPKQLDWEVVIRAPAKALNFRLQGELHGYAAQLVNELAEHTQQAATTVAQIDTVLADLQTWFNHRSSVESIFLPLLSNTLNLRVNPAQILSQLESEVGCPLQQWNTLDASQIAVLRQQLLTKTQPLCLEIYTECCRSLLNLDLTTCQTQTINSATPVYTALATRSPQPERRVSLQVQNAALRDVLMVLGQANQVKVLVDKSISGEISLVLSDVSFTEALDTLTVVSNLTYSKSGDVYTFWQPATTDN